MICYWQPLSTITMKSSRDCSHCTQTSENIRRKGRKRNLDQSRSSSGTSVTTRMAGKKALPILALAWSMAAFAPNLLPVAVALPDVKSSTLSTGIERALDKKTKKKIKESLRTTKTKKQKIEEDASRSKKGNQAANSSTNDPNSIEQRVQIEGLLARRKFPVRTFLRTVCLLLAVRSFSQCSQTSGIPYAQTVMQIVYGTSEAAKKVGCIPTAMERKLADMILSSSNDFSVMLPPRILPSAGPLLKFVASIVAYIGLTFLLPLWSTQFRVLLDYRKLEENSKSKSKDMSVLVRLDGSSGGGSIRKTKRNNLEIIPLQKSSVKKKKSKKNAMQRNSKGNNDVENMNYVHPTDFFFDVDHSRIYCDLDTKECIDGAPSLQRAPLKDLQNLIEGGGLSKKMRTIAKERYEVYNTFPLATPTFQEAILERISSPLVVIQLVGRLVALLEEGMGALISMLMTLVQHFYYAKQAIVSATQLAEEVKTNLQDTSGYKVSVWNESKQRWISTAAGELVPGDMFRLTMSQEERKNSGTASDKTQKQQELIVPVDALVIKGQCLTNEAILTGESVPQIKIPLDFQDEIADERNLDLHKDRSSILFAGTTLFHTLGGSTPSNENGSHEDSTGGGVTCIALRTGTYSSKGRLLKALKGSSHVGAISNDQSEKDAIRMIASLSGCAVLSCLSLFVQRNSNSARISPFRRVIQCTRIAMASIPSDLPLAQASIARACSRMLRDQSDVVCSEPGSLLTAAYVDTVVFDKTGTLTADTQSLSKIVSVESEYKSVQTGTFQRFVLSGCHSLVHFEENGKMTVIGDPLDQAALEFSGWKYNQTAGFYFRPESDSEPISSSEPIRLWQIRDFPFDPSRRLSSAIVLMERKDSSLELWKLIKGSPDTMIDLIDKDSDDLEANLRNKTQELEMQGYRCISMGAGNLEDSQVEKALFPNGLSATSDTLLHSRKNGEKLQRSSIDSPEAGLKFCGFCCFDASTRQSSKRVINELVRGGLKCVMLTGDSVDAALSVARKVELLSSQKIAVLERSENDYLIWKILHSKVKKDGSFRILHDRTKIETVTVSSVKKYIKHFKKGKYSIAANGRALELIFSGEPNEVGQLIKKNLSALSVIARATPELKKQVIDTLKKECGKRVMMCGDGVNDVAAIQSADVAASLLTGFGSEKEASGIDVDDKRRMKRLDTMNVGRNRSKNVGNAKKQEANMRIQKEVQRIQKEIEKGASARGDNNTNSSDRQYTIEDMKRMLSATMQAARNERQRAEKLRKGGGDAARILAEERQDQISSENEDNVGPPQIKPGEASLVSSFSCLHPSVDGVDAILREGVATAASSLATQQGIGLHSLMSCFHLATLYRDGFRYGNQMWNVELFFYSFLENARSKASCTPRPRLPSTVSNRPPTSLFQFVSIFGILSQAIIHLSCMAMSVRYAKHIVSDTKDNLVGKKIRLENSFASDSLKVGKLVDTLSKRSLIDGTEGDTNQNPFFRRPPFRPNYETNSVFLLSILQSAISALVGHTGAPFYRTILESRDLCVASGMTLLFVMVCITGKIPLLTRFLEVKPLPSRHTKLAFVGIVMINILACAFCRLLMDNFLAKSNGLGPDATTSTAGNHGKNAADHEEKLLWEERKHNLKGLRVFLAIIGYLMIDLLL